MSHILHTFLFKALRGLLAGVFGWAVAQGYMTSGQTEYVLEALLSALAWLSSAFLSSVMHDLKMRHALGADPNGEVTLAEIRAAAWTAALETLRKFFRKLEKDGSDDVSKK